MAVIFKMGLKIKNTYREAYLLILSLIFCSTATALIKYFIAMPIDKHNFVDIHPGMFRAELYIIDI